MTDISSEAVVRNTPPGRGRWRITLHDRVWQTGVDANATIIAELSEARSRRLEQKLNYYSTLTFSIDGRSPGAALIKELEHDVIAWRWDEYSGTDVAMVRAIVSQTEDVISENVHTLNVTAHDYLSMMQRRCTPNAIGSPGTPSTMSQDAWVEMFRYIAVDIARNRLGDRYFMPGSYLPLVTTLVNPDGTGRSDSNVSRDREYGDATNLGKAIDDMASDLGGFDYDALPNANGDDRLRVFYPAQGITRSEPMLEYGSTLAAVTRTVNSQAYANYVQVVGNTIEGEGTMYSDAYLPESYGTRVGLWGDWINASDVSVQSTLDEKCQGTLADAGVLTPTYSITLSPDVFAYNRINMGDNVRVIIKSGRLNVDTYERVVGRNFAISDDGTEDVELTVGTPLVTVRNMLDSQQNDIDALARR